MKSIFALILLAGVSFAAQARPNSWDMTCAEARNLVDTNGAVVMNYGYSPAAGYLYERYVANDSYCDSHEMAQPAYVPTTDDDSCYVGGVCVDNTHD